MQKLVDGFFLAHDKELLTEIFKISQKKNAPLNKLIDENYIKGKMQPFYSFDDKDHIAEWRFVSAFYNGTAIQTENINSLTNKCKNDPKFLPTDWVYTDDLKFLFLNGKPINGVVRLNALASSTLFLPYNYLILKIL